jgi:hypothetical protein
MTLCEGRLFVQVQKVVCVGERWQVDSSKGSVDG